MNIGGIEFDVLPEPCADDDHEYVEEPCYVDDEQGKVFFPQRCKKCRYVSMGWKEIAGKGMHTMELWRKGQWR